MILLQLKLIQSHLQIMTGTDCLNKPFIANRRGEAFADSNEVEFFPKSFPCLFPGGTGGPKNITLLAETVDGTDDIDSDIEGSKSVNFTLRSWAKFLLQLGISETDGLTKSLGNQKHATFCGLIGPKTRQTASIENSAWRNLGMLFGTRESEGILSRNWYWE